MAEVKLTLHPFYVYVMQYIDLFHGENETMYSKFITQLATRRDKERLLFHLEVAFSSIPSYLGTLNLVR